MTQFATSAPIVLSDWQAQLAALCVGKSFKRLPTKADEAWKYTALEVALQSIPVKSAQIEITKTPAFSAISQADMTRLRTASDAGHYTAPYDLTSMYCDVCTQRLSLDACTEIEPVLRHMNIQGDGLAMTHTMIQVTDGTHQVLIETVDADGTSWLNQSVDIQVGTGASLLHIRHYTVPHAAAVMTHSARVQVAKDGRYTALIIADHAGLQRNDIQIDLLGEGAEGQAYGLHLAQGDAHPDLTVLLRHLAPSCRSDQFVRSIIKDRAQSVFQGKIYVGQVAQQTDGYQLSNAILLSPQATMQVKPELEIYADDVKCSHGATTAPMDEDALFYMRSRGLPEQTAQKLVMTAFCAEVLDRVPDEAQREVARERIDAWLSIHL